MSDPMFDQLQQILRACRYAPDVPADVLEIQPHSPGTKCPTVLGLEASPSFFAAAQIRSSITAQILVRSNSTGSKGSQDSSVKPNPKGKMLSHTAVSNGGGSGGGGGGTGGSDDRIGGGAKTCGSDIELDDEDLDGDAQHALADFFFQPPFEAKLKKTETKKLDKKEKIKRRWTKAEQKKARDTG